MSIIIPDWVPRTPKPVDATGQAPPNHATAAAQGSTPADLSIAALGRDQIIPILYGGPERMAGLVYCVATPKVGALAGRLVFAAVLCEGPVESVGDFQVNGEALPAYISVTAYTGEAGQPIDPWLAAAIPGFDETLEGVAYFVATVAQTDSTGFPPITAMVKGSKVFDPRSTFYQVLHTFAAPWIDAPPSVLVMPSTSPARDGSMTAYDLSSSNGGARKYTWVVPDDSRNRSTSISIAKVPGALHRAGVGIAYTGGAVALGRTVQVNLDDGTLTPYAGAGGQFRVVDRITHWEVLVAMANNSTGNTSFSLSLYPSLA